MPTTYTSAEAIADIPGAEYDTLRARFAGLAAVQDILAAERIALWREIDAREKEVRARLRLGAFNAAELEMYRDIINSPYFTRT